MKFDDFRENIFLNILNIGVSHMSLVLRKPVFGVSDQVCHKLGCVVTENG